MMFLSLSKLSLVSCLELTLKTTSAQVVIRLVNVTSNSPSQDFHSPLCEEAFWLNVDC